MQKAESVRQLTEEEELEEKQKNDPHKGLPGDPTWSVEDRQKVLNRLRGSGTPLGLTDYAFDANAMVTDAYDVAMPKIFALHEMMDSITQAARKMRDVEWERFQEIPHRRVHEDDKQLHGSIFATKEPTWKTLLQKPKKTKQTCVFLHIGTEPPSRSLADFLTKLGWYGVCIGPLPPPPGNEDLVQFTEIDPSSWNHQGMVDGLTSSGGGLVPRPAQFGLALVNVTFNHASDAEFIDPYDENFHELVRLRNKRRAERAERREKLGLGMSSFEDNITMPAPSPITATGHGKVGISRGERVRRRLRALKNSLKVSLHRLQNDGSLVVFWPGLPLHPVLFFLAASLRKVFQRVHVMTSPGSKTFDIYILAVGFKREKAEDKTPGLGGLELKSFLDSSWRSESLDDVLLWTLPQYEEEEEMLVGASGRGIVASYADLWNTFSEKFRALAMELGVVIISADGVLPNPMPVKEQAAPKAKAKAKAKAAAEKKTGPKEGASSSSKDEPEESKKAEKEQGTFDVQANAEKPAQSADRDPTKAGGTDRSASKEDPKPKNEQTKEIPMSKAGGTDPSASKEDPKTKNEETKEIPMSKAGETDRKASKAKYSKDTRVPSKEVAKPDTSGETDKSAANANDASKQAKPDSAEAKADAEFNKSLDDILIEADNQGEPKVRFRLNRCVLTLSGSLGASPGHKYKHPDYVELAGQWPLVQAAYEVGKRGRIKRKNPKENVAALPALSPLKAPPYFTCSSPKFNTRRTPTSPSLTTAQARTPSTSRTGMLSRSFSTPVTPAPKLGKTFPSSPQLSKT
eukprot:TRINITY_DN2393_c0_g1_i1.p1 TRINITY_DN2393_c0_g1~~TRINITY_DN2393_c0_g1_i1.p1  ORF type:complete len:801 (-),score=129.77 TRINITY_DN2393_c0_g1_i1:286-2688(-)